MLKNQEDSTATGMSKKFWYYIKHRRLDDSGIGTLRVNSKLVANPTEKAEALNQQFRSVFMPVTDVLLVGVGHNQPH